MSRHASPPPFYFRILGIFYFNKTNETIGILRNSKYFLPPEVLKIIYVPQVQPYIYFGIGAWFASHEMYYAMVVLQKKAWRAKNNLSCTEHTNVYLKSMNILII